MNIYHHPFTTRRMLFNDIFLSFRFATVIMRSSFLSCFVVLTLLLSENSAIDHYGVKLAANGHLLVSIQYQCSPNRDQVFYTHFDLRPVYTISIDKAQTQSELYFVLAGMINESIPYMSKITVNCRNDTSDVVTRKTVFFQKQMPSHFAVAVDPRGHFAVGFTNQSTI